MSSPDDAAKRKPKQIINIVGVALSGPGYYTFDELRAAYYRLARQRWPTIRTDEEAEQRIKEWLRTDKGLDTRSINNLPAFTLLRWLEDEVSGTIPSKQDGPVEPDGWLHNGNRVSGKLPPKAFALIRYLWECPDMTADIRDLAQPMFGDDASFIEVSNIQDHSKAVNNFFRDNKLDWSVVTASKPYPTASLVSRPPKPRD